MNKIPKRIFETYAKHILHHDGSSLFGARIDGELLTITLPYHLSVLLRRLMKSFTDKGK